MVKAVFASLVGVAAAGGKLALTWEDCGDASTHGKTTDLQPSEIVLGVDTQLVGTGTTDKEISSGSFTMKLTASLGIKETYEGKICEAKEFKMPLGIGTVSWAGMDCPVAVGASTVKVGVHMSSLVPADLAKADLALTALDQDGESAVCVNTHLVKESLSSALDIDCSTAACPDQCACSLDKCGSEIDACLAVDNCAKAQTCALACPCSDNACILKCAASSPSIKALPAAECINSQCSSLKVADTCSLFEIADDSCGQSDLNCDYVKYAKAAEKGLQDGTCADQGYTVQTGTQTKTYPIIGDIVITTYSKGLSSSADIDCSTATCPEACTCSLDKCASEIAACLAVDNCAKAQTCALACGCGDTACTLKCAAASPSIKALPAAECINSNCNIPPAAVSV